jgi:hypothetical protein
MKAFALRMMESSTELLDLLADAPSTNHLNNGPKKQLPPTPFNGKKHIFYLSKLSVL